MLLRMLPTLAIVLADVSVCCTATTNAAPVETIDKSICGTESHCVIASGERDDLTIGVSNRQSETRPASEVTAEDCLSPGYRFSNAAYAASDEWSIEITNEDDQNDYPASVQGEGTYNIIVNLRVNVPMGQTGKVSVDAYSPTVYSDPPLRRYVGGEFLPSLQGRYRTEVGNGTRTMELSFDFLTPGVIRESWAGIRVDAELFEGNQTRDWTGYYYQLTILPSQGIPVDVKFTGTVESLDVFWDKFVIGAQIRIDEVKV